MDPKSPDAASQPLIEPDPRDDDDPSHDPELAGVSLLLEKNLVNPGVFVWLLTITAGISGLLFGYDTGVISATLVSIDSSLGHPLTILDKSLITSATALFALLVSPISGLISDSLGRKRVVLLADAAFVAGAVVQAATNSVWGMIIGRSIVGLAVGAGSFVAPLYIAELAPSPFRGRLVVLNVLFITLGQVVAYIIGWAFVQWGNENTAWRWMVGLGAVPAAIQCLIMLFMPESPRWLVRVGRNEEARSVLNQVFGKGSEIQRMVDGVLKGIEVEVREEEDAKKGRVRAQKKKDGDSWFPGLSDTWIELFRIALVLIDRIGRRRMLLYSVPIMALGLLLCSAGFYFITLPTDLHSINPSSTADAYDEVPLSDRTAPLLVLASVMLYVGAYALGLGNVPWMQSELFPLNVRSLGSSLSTSTNWGSNFIVGLTFLPMMEFLTPAWTFVIYAGVCIAGWICIWRIYPETKGLSLEETGALLANGWGVRESLGEDNS
ncbi:hypothetical protein B7494_g7089 [Chlorociboria aeruginascens]|nr:hypothetical protein B7494_g7089 [Chlorociboria aeruginascens]